VYEFRCGHNLKRLQDFFGAGYSVDAINVESRHRWGEHGQSYGVRVSNKRSRSTLTGSRNFLTGFLLRLYPPLPSCNAFCNHSY